MDLSWLLNLTYAILGIGLIIFIHELGHFLLAKRVGVRVEVFSLGFDPVIRGRRMRLFSFERGGTVYSVGAIPFGGYVKMAGETALERKEEGRPPRSDELLAKPPGQRAIVFAAGAVFNIASAFLFFILAFQLGVKFPAPAVGQVEVGRPAWRAGILAGDVVEAIDGERISDFYEIAISSALGDPRRPRRFTVRRDGQTLDFEITPAWTPEFGFHSFGVHPVYDPEVKKVRRGRTADRADMRKGDRIHGVRLGGVFFPGPLPLVGGHMTEYLTVHPGAPFEVGLERAGEPGVLWKEVRLERKPSVTTRPKLGIMPAADLVQEIRPGSRAGETFSAGDRVRAVHRDVASFDWVTVLDNFGKEGPVELLVESLAGSTRQVTVDAGQLIEWSLRREIDWSTPKLRVAKVVGQGPLSLSVQPGDLLVAVGPEKRPVSDPESLAEALSRSGDRPGLWVRRGKEFLMAEAPAGALEDGQVEWDRSPPLRVLSGLAAHKAGMRPGSRLTAIAGQPVRSWQDLETLVGKSTGGPLEVKWVEPDGTERHAALDTLAGDRHDNYEDLGLGFDFQRNLVRAGILDSFVLGANRTWVVGQHVFMTLKGLLSRQVSARNLAGPVGIVNLIFHVSDLGLGTLIYYLALISVNLGLFNLLPFPILDGGHLLFLAIEKIKGSPVDVRIQEIATTLAFFLIIGLALFVTFHDVRRLLGFGL